MAGSTSQVQQIKEATDIVSLIGQKVDLKRSGANWRGLCPFHGEKSPSFFVNDQLQRYKCFGCGESGDVFTFLEKYEGMSFGESLRFLADAAGITLLEFTFDQQDNRREQLLAILHVSKEYYHYLLMQHAAGEPARQYLKQRGVHQTSFKLFELGYSLDAWDGLYTYLVEKKKYSPELVEEAGLIIKGKGGRYYDRFRGRVMFPLKNHRGQVVGFSGRTLDPEAKTAKYINSPETELYHKSELLYGLSELYQEIRKAGYVLVTEGEFDVISSAQAHVNAIVAIKGSALTVQHLERLKRTVGTVILALDADSAGVQATKRAIGLVQAAGLELRVIPLKGGKDVDEIARTESATWREVSKQSVTVFDYLLEVALRQHNPATADGKRNIMAELGPVLAQVQLAVERDVYIAKLAKALRAKESAVTTDLRQFNSVAKQTAVAATPAKPFTLSSDETLERYCLYLLLQQPANRWTELLLPFKHLTWSQSGMSAIITSIVTTRPDSLTALAAALDADLQQLVMEVQSWPAFATALHNSTLAEEWKTTQQKIIQRATREHIKAVSRQLEAVESEETLDEEGEKKQAALLQELVKLQSKLKSTY